MPLLPLPPNEMIDAFHNQLLAGPNAGERVAVIELSSSRLRFAIFRYSAFCNFRRIADYEFPQGAQLMQAALGGSVASLTAQLRQTLRAFEPRYIGVFVLGDLSDDPQLLSVISQVFGSSPVPLVPDATAKNLPPNAYIKSELDLIPCITPHTLQLLVVTLDDDQGEFVERTVDLYTYGEPVNSGATLAEIQLLAPALNRDFLLCFQETLPGMDYPQNGYYYRVRAKKPVFTARVVFKAMTHDWDIELDPHEASLSPTDPTLGWSGTRSPFNVSDSRPLPRHPKVDKALPNLVIVVESALGMQRVYAEHLGNTPSVDSTDFKIVRNLCSTIVESLYELDDLRFLLVFYGSHQGKPGEFRNIKVKRASPVVRHLPNPNGEPRFVHRDAILQSINKDFLNEQTATSTWHKSVDEALHYLNTRVPWDHSDHVVVWIVQSPPFEYARHEMPSLDKPGFPGQYNRAEELRHLLNEVGAKNLVLLVTGDIPVNREDLLELAHTSWLQVVEGDESRLFTCRAADESDEISDNVIWQLRALAPFRARRLARNTDRDRQMLLPLYYDPDHPLVYVESV